MWYIVVFQPSKCRNTHFQPQIWSIWPIFPNDSESLPKVCYINWKNSEILSKLRNYESAGGSELHRNVAACSKVYNTFTVLCFWGYLTWQAWGRVRGRSGWRPPTVAEPLRLPGYFSYHCLVFLLTLADLVQHGRVDVARHVVVLEVDKWVGVWWRRGSWSREVRWSLAGGEIKRSRSLVVQRGLQVQTTVALLAAGLRDSAAWWWGRLPWWPTPQPKINARGHHHYYHLDHQQFIRTVTWWWGTLWGRGIARRCHRSVLLDSHLYQSLWVK